MDSFHKKFPGRESAMDRRRVERPAAGRSEAARALAAALDGGRATREPSASMESRESKESRELREPRESREALLRAYGGRPREAREAAGNSATAVAMATRRSAARSPRDVNVLVDKLLASVHGAPSAITTRRAVVRLHDSIGQHAVDSVRAVRRADDVTLTR